MRKQPGTFGQTQASLDRRALAASIRMRALVAVMSAAMVVVWVIVETGVAGAAQSVAGTSWQEQAFVLLGGPVFAGVSAVALRGIGRCRRAPRVLAPVVGVRATVGTVGYLMPGQNGTTVYLRVAGADVRTQLLEPASVSPSEGDVGMLYRCGRVAAFVTQAGTYWAV